MSSRGEIYLQPGEYFVGDDSVRIRTLLGSCVSVTLWHPTKKIGAMSHFLLIERERPEGDKLDARYGNEAISLMLYGLAHWGVDHRECEAKIFGGGDMFPRFKAPNRIGQNNGEGARRLIRAHGIPLISENLYGAGHREIIFDIANGDVWARQHEVKDISASQKRRRG